MTNQPPENEGPAAGPGSTPLDTSGAADSLGDIFSPIARRGMAEELIASCGPVWGVIALILLAAGLGVFIFAALQGDGFSDYRIFDDPSQIGSVITQTAEVRHL